MLSLRSTYARAGTLDLAALPGLLDAQLAALVHGALAADRDALAAATHLGQEPHDAPPGYEHTRDAYLVEAAGLAGRLIQTAPQFEYQIRDTAAHGPVSAQALHFWDGGTEVFARHVSGTHANEDLVAALAAQHELIAAVVAARAPELLAEVGI